MQDNAPIYIAKKVREWFEEQGIDPTDWPPYSLDFNPIEYIWKKLKELIYELFPNIKQLKRSVESQQDELFRALEIAWEQIDEEWLNVLVNSMQKRVAAVIAADSWYTKY